MAWRLDWASLATFAQPQPPSAKPMREAIHHHMHCANDRLYLHVL